MCTCRLPVQSSINAYNDDRHLYDQKIGLILWRSTGWLSEQYAACGFDTPSSFFKVKTGVAGCPYGIEEVQLVNYVPFSGVQSKGDLYLQIAK